MRPILAAALLLAACGPAPSAPQADTMEPASDVRNTVAALADGPRKAVLIRAIRDAGFDCQGVVEAHRQGEGASGDPLYVAQCTDKTPYGVLFGRDGTAHVAVHGDR